MKSGGEGLRDWDDLPTYLTPEEVAQFLRLSLAHIYRMIRRHEIAHTHYGRTIRIDRDGLRGGAKPNHTHASDPSAIAAPIHPLRLAPRRTQVKSIAGG